MVLGGHFLLDADKSAALPGKEQGSFGQTDLEDRHKDSDPINSFPKVQVVPLEDLKKGCNQEDDS